MSWIVTHFLMEKLRMSNPRVEQAVQFIYGRENSHE
jgi:hypothetical protein